jgi:hypothetical protein
MRAIASLKAAIGSTAERSGRRANSHGRVNPPIPSSKRTNSMNIAESTQETLGLMKESLAKNVTLSTGLSAYDLQAPAKNLYPVVTPLRNSLPRVGRPNPGDAARWRTITSVLGSGYDAMGWDGCPKASARRACPIRRSSRSPRT